LASRLSHSDVASKVVPDPLRKRFSRLRRAAVCSGPGARHFDEKVLWIFGSPRSGSTWLLWMLRDHPSIVPINEPLIGYHLGPFLADTPGFQATGLDRDNFTLRRAKRHNRNQFFADEFGDVWSPMLGRFMRERFEAHLRRYPPPAGYSNAVLAIKEPNGSQAADLVMEAMPGSRLCFLLRDGRDVVDSELAGVLEGGWAGAEFDGARGVVEDQRLEYVSQAARKWLWRTEIVQQAFERHAGPKVLVRYEDLRRDPLAEMDSLFTWLELEIAPPELESLVSRHAFEALDEAKRGPDKFYRSAEPGAWERNLTEGEQEAIHDIIGPKLAELGYAV
jgi:hypothetical protein